MVRPDVARAKANGSAATTSNGPFAWWAGGGARRGLMRPRPLDINAVVISARVMLCRMLGDHIQLSTLLAGGLWPVVADPGQLEMVLVNLAVNAGDAMPVGGVLTIDTANVVNGGGARGHARAPRGPVVRLRVSDTGTGMTRQVLDHIFEPFYTTKGAGAGTGLGLATVCGIVAQAGGQIQVCSRPGTGTTFTVSLPATTGVAGPPVKNPASLRWPAARALYSRRSTGYSRL